VYSLFGRRASVELQVRLDTSDGALVWFGGQSVSTSGRLPLMTLDVVDGCVLLTWYLHDDHVKLTAWNGERIDDNSWHTVRAHRYVVPAVCVQPTGILAIEGLLTQ